MEINEILSFFNLASDDKYEVKDIFDNSKKINKDSIFLAIDNGTKYIDEALQNGARLVLSNINIKKTKVIYVPQLKTKLTTFLMYFYNHPEDKLILIGVTGTNGKSTSAYIIHSILEKSLLITTVEGIKNSVVCANTTPSGVELAHIFNYANRNGYKYVVMEVSSIGIKEHRVSGLNFNYVLFTNLGSDHLDYHQTIEEYHRTKIDFLESQDGIIVVNEDDQLCHLSKPHFAKYISYRVSPSSIILHDENGIIYQYDEKHTLFLLMIGLYNLSNAIGAISLCSLIMPLNKIIKKAKHIKPLLGRLNIMSHQPLIIIDYAHTEAALNASLREIKKLITGRLIVVFGAGGDRDKSKRSLYGNIIKKHEALGVVTNDNPRNEDEEQIINDIVKDLDYDFITEKNRSEAIKIALKHASKNDAVIITGKGHEQYQIIKNKRIPYSDFEEVKKWIRHQH